MTTFLRTTEIPVAGARTLPGRYFTSPEIHREEMAKLFARRWLCVGRADGLAEPGGYLLREIGGESVIVLRDRSGTARAFYNVCRHRGCRLTECPTGRFEGTIQCPYHAWSYALDGRLIGAPSTSGMPDFRREDWPLHALRVAEWEGFLFVHLDPDPEPFARAWAPMLGRFARFSMPRLVTAETITYDVRANWKLVFQNYSECYHCAPVHPALAKASPPTSGENDLIEGPFTGGFMTINPGFESLTVSGRACGVMVGDLPEEDRRRVYYYAILPNLLLSLHPDYVMVHTLWPRAADRTAIECSWLVHPDTLAGGGYDPRDGVRFWDETNRQDWHICEQSQLGVSSRAYRPGPYSPRESLPARFDREVLRALGHEDPWAQPDDGS